MSRLYDRIARGQVIWDDEIKSLDLDQAALFSDTTVVVADNIAKFWVDNLNNPTPLDDFNTLCLAPSFDNCFIEGRFHSRVFPYAAGLLTLAFNIDSGTVLFSEEIDIGIHPLVSGYSGPTPKFKARDATWILVSDLFVQIDKDSEAIQAGFLGWIYLDEKGYSLNKTQTYIGRTSKSSFAEFMGFDSIVPVVRSLMPTLSFLHTKNVEIIDNPPPPKLSRKHEKEYGVPLVTYKTLKVNPMRTVKRLGDLDTVGQSSKSQDTHLPLALWRGHFKDFRDGKGLFGKLKGVYWWDQHVRGSIENGAVIKDYDVQAPKE